VWPFKPKIDHVSLAREEADRRRDADRLKLRKLEIENQRLAAQIDALAKLKAQLQAAEQTAAEQPRLRLVPTPPADDAGRGFRDLVAAKRPPGPYAEPSQT
jgi:hypothetical protein